MKRDKAAADKLRSLLARHYDSMTDEERAALQSSIDELDPPTDPPISALIGEALEFYGATKQCMCDEWEPKENGCLMCRMRAAVAR